MIFLLLILSVVAVVTGQTCVSDLTQGSLGVVTGYSENAPGACVIDGLARPLLFADSDWDYLITGGFQYLSPTSAIFMGVSIVGLSSITGTIRYITDHPADTYNPEIGITLSNMNFCADQLYGDILKYGAQDVAVKNVTCSSCLFSASSGYCAVWNVTFSIPLATLAQNLGQPAGLIRLDLYSAVTFHGIYEISVDDGSGPAEKVELMVSSDIFVPACSASLPVYNPSLPQCSQSPSASPSESFSQSLSESVSQSSTSGQFCCSPYFASVNISGMNTSYPGVNGSSDTCNIAGTQRGFVYSNTVNAVSMGYSINRIGPTSVLVFNSYVVNSLTLVQLRYSVIRRQSISAVTNVVFNGTFVTTSSQTFSCGVEFKDNPRCTQPNITAGCTNNARNMTKSADTVVSCNTGCMFGSGGGLCTVFDVYVNVTTDFTSSDYGGFIFDILPQSVTPSTLPAFGIYKVDVLVGSVWSSAPLMFNACDLDAACTSLMYVFNPSTSTCPSQSQSISMSPFPTESASESLSASDSFAPQCGCDHEQVEGDGPEVVVISKGDSSLLVNKNCYVNNTDTPLLYGNGTSADGFYYYDFKTPLLDMGGGFYKVYGVLVNSSSVNIKYSIVSSKLIAGSKLVILNVRVVSRITEGFQCGDQALYNTNLPTIDIEQLLPAPPKAQRVNVTCSAECPFATNGYCAANTETLTFPVTSIAPSWLNMSYLVISVVTTSSFIAEAGIYGIDVYNGSNWVSVDFAKNTCSSIDACESQLDYWKTYFNVCPTPTQSPTPSQSQTPSQSPTVSVPGPAYANCSSPFHSVQFNTSIFANMSKGFFFQYYNYYNTVNEGNVYFDYYDTFLEKNNLLSHFLASQAGTNNCSKYDRVWQRDNIVSGKQNVPYGQVRANLYLEILNYFNGSHSIADVLTTDPKLNITFTYIQPHLLASYPYASEVVALNCSLTNTSGCAVTGYMIDSVGAYTDMCTDVTNRYSSIFYGVKEMACTVLSYVVTSNATNDCEAGCLQYDQYGIPNYSCDEITINCVEDFPVVPLDQSFAPGNRSFVFFAPGNSDKNPLYQNFSLVNMSISDGNRFVKVDIVARENPNIPCEDVFKLEPVSLNLPVCCTEEYVNFLHPLSSDSSISQTYEPYECVWQQKIENARDYVVPQIGYSINVPIDRYVKNHQLIYAYYFSKEHVNALFEKAWYIDPNFGGDLFQFLTINEGSYPGSPKATYGSTCGLVMTACDQPDYFSCIPYTDVIPDVAVDYYGFSIETCPSLLDKLSPFNTSYSNQLMQYNESFVAVYILQFFQGVQFEFRPNRHEDILFNIAWDSVFPGDVVLIDLIGHLVSDSGSNEVLVRHKTSPCTGPFNTEPICTCLDCGQLTQESTSESVLTYSTTPLIVDNNMKQTHDNNQRFSRRAPSNPDFPVSANLYGFIRDNIPATPNLVNMTTPDVATLMQANGCGVLVDVRQCSNSLRVWFKPNATVSTQNLTLPAKMYSSLRCNLMITHDQFTGLPMPLTDKVYVSGPSEWLPGPYNFIPSKGPSQWIIPFDIVSSSNSSDPQLRFDQDVYGIEIPLASYNAIGGIYMYCDVGVATSNVTRQPMFTRNQTTGMNYCVSRQRESPVEMLVEPIDNFAQQDGNNTYRMHLMASPSCPAFGMCPPQWFVNQPYEVNYGSMGPVFQFPSDNLIENQNISILPYEVDITFKMNSPELQVVVDEYLSNVTLFRYLLFRIEIQGPFAPTNFLDMDIMLSDSTCASKTLCSDTRVIVNKTRVYQDNGGSIFESYVRTMGMGAKLGEGGFNSQSSLDITTVVVPFDTCYIDLVNSGYVLSDVALLFRFNVDNLTLYDQSSFNDTDYSEGPDTSSNPYGPKGEDAITRRLYIYSASFEIVPLLTDNLIFPTPASSIVTFQPNGTCGRQPYTVVNTCNGVCDEFTSRGQLFDSVDNITAKAENHPNATFYDSVGLNSTRVNEQLLQVNFPYNENLLQIQPGQTYQDDIVTGASVCNYWATLLSHEIAVNGTAHVLNLNLTLPPVLTGGANFTYFAFMGTYKTELLVQALNMFAMTIAQPWVPGVFLTFDNETQMVHVFGTTIGIAIAAHANSTILQQPICDNDPYCQAYPKPVIMFYDFYVPNVTRDFVNIDADLISRANDFIPGPYFSQGVSPFEFADFSFVIDPYEHPAYGPDAPCLMRSMDMCGAAFNSYNPMQSTDGTTLPEIYAYGSTRNYGDVYVEPIQYPNLVGNDPNITTRLGNGVDDGGMLGALPIVASFYARSSLRITLMWGVFYFLDNIAGNETVGRQRFRMALYPCFTKCPNNATHYMKNHPDFSATSFMNTQTTTLVANATNDLQVFNLTHNQYTENTVYDEMNIGEVLNSLTNNLLGGVVYSYQYKTGGARRGQTVSEGNFVLVLNVDQTDIGEVLALIGNENVTAYVYDILQLTAMDVGLYMNLRDTLGSIDMFGLVFGILYYREIGFDNNMMVPYDVVLSTFGDYESNRDLVLFPILRKKYDNDLYLASEDYCNNYTGSCRQTGSIRSYYLNNQGAISTADPLLENFGFQFNSTDDNGLIFYDTLVSVGYQGTNQYIVTAYGNYTPIDNKTDTTGYDGGFRLICADCWDAFNDAVYFNWFNYCPTFLLCSYANNTTSPVGGQCIPGFIPSVSQLNLTIPASSSLSVTVAWTNQSLTSSYLVNAIVTLIATGKACTVLATVNNASALPAVLPLNVPVSVYATIPFDGDNLTGVFVFNTTGCAPIVTDIAINYTFPVPCPTEATLTRSQSQTQSKTPVQSPSQSKSPVHSSTRSPTKSHTPLPTQPQTRSRTQSKSQSQSLSYSDSMSASGSPSESAAITQSPSIPPPVPASLSESNWIIIVVSSAAALGALLLMLFVYLCTRSNKSAKRNPSINAEIQPLVKNKMPTYSHKRYE